MSVWETSPVSEPEVQRRGSVGEVFLAFLRLGATSFGGPIAHLGYFRDDLVARRRWLGDDAYAELVAICQFLPGPASSQVGFGLGWLRAGPWGALAAFVAFTLPSAVLMLALAAGAAWFGGPVGAALAIGLGAVAVAIVAHAVWGMARTLATGRVRASVAAVAAVCALVLPGSVGQLLAIGLGALAGVLWLRGDPADAGTPLAFGIPRWAGWLCLALFALLVLGLPVVARVTASGAVDVFAAFASAGALVFGGGHVVLPLLESAVVQPGWVSPDQFLAGYGAAQALPGPLFTVAAFLGSVSTTGPGGVLGGLLALVAIFLPGFLLLTGVLPFWGAIRTRRWAQGLIRGANAAVVGILAAALYDPVFVTAITGPATFGLALVCFVLLIAWRIPPWLVVIVGAAGGLVLGLSGWA